MAFLALNPDIVVLTMADMATPAVGHGFNKLRTTAGPGCCNGRPSSASHSHSVIAIYALPSDTVSSGIPTNGVKRLAEANVEVA